MDLLLTTLGWREIDSSAPAAAPQIYPPLCIYRAEHKTAVLLSKREYNCIKAIYRFLILNFTMLHDHIRDLLTIA